MNPTEAISAAFELLPERMRSVQAATLLLAVQFQEAPNQEQRQIGGPAVGIWQFEEDGGIAGVIRHQASRQYALSVCEALGVEPTKAAVYAELQSSNDVLDAAFARLLMWTDALPLPAIGDVDAGFKLYLRTWRPGAYGRGNAATRRKLRQKWSINYAKALEAMAVQ